MAASQIDIKIRTLIEGAQGIQALISQINALSSSASGFNPAAAGAANSTGALGDMLQSLSQHAADTQVGLRSLQSDLGAVGEGMSSLAKYAKGAAVAFLGFLAVNGAKEMAEYAARTETLGVTLDVVANNAGYTKDQISKYEGELHKLGITTQAARESMTAMIQAGIPLEAQAGKSASNVALLARAAQDLAVVTGEDSSTTLKRLTTNIQQMDTMGLRFMGLTVNIEAAQERYASSLNKSNAALAQHKNETAAAAGGQSSLATAALVTKDTLTQQQKIMAVNNAVLEEATKLQGAYEQSMETAGKKLTSMKRLQEDLADTMGKKLLPAFGQLIDAASWVLKTLDSIGNATDKSGKDANELGDAVGQLARQFADLVVTVVRAVSESSGGFTTLITQITGLLGDFVELTTSLVGSADSMNLLGVEVLGLNVILATVRDSLKLLALGFNSIEWVVASTISTIAKGWGLLMNLMGSTVIGDALLSLSDSSDKAAQKSGALAVSLATAFDTGNTSLMHLANGVSQVSLSLSDFGKGATFKDVTSELEKLGEASRGGAASTAEFGKAQSLAAGDVVKLIESNKLSKEQITALIEAAEAAGIKLPSSFSSASVAAKTLEDNATKMLLALSKVGEAKTLSGLTEEINTVLQAQQRGIGTSRDYGNAYVILSEKVKQFGLTNQASARDLNDMNKKLANISASIAAEYDAALKAMGVSTSELTTGVGEKTALMAGALSTLASNAMGTAEVFSAAFSKGMDTSKSVADLAAFTASIAQAKETAQKLKEQGDEAGGDKWLKAASSAASEAKLKFDDLFASSLKSATTQQELDRLGEAVKRFATATGESTAWVNDKLSSIGAEAGRLATKIEQADISGAIKKIGISAEEMSAQTSLSNQSVIEGLNSLAKTASVTGDEYYRAFSKGIGLAKTTADIAEFKGALSNALAEGKVDWTQYTSLMQTVGDKFDEVFNKQLKAAKTTEDFAQLREEVTKLGTEGAISGEKVASYLQQINQQASGAAAQLSKMNQDALANARSMGAVVQAQNGVMSTSLDIVKARGDLTRAETQAARDGSAVSAADVKIKQASLAVANAHLVTQQAIVVAKQAELDLQQAQQNLASAQAAYDKDSSDANGRAVKHYQAQVTSKKELVTTTQKVVQEAQNEEEVLKSSVIAATLLKEEVSQVGEGTEEVVRDTGAVAAGVNELIPTYGKVVARLKEAGYATEEANAYSKELTDTFSRLSGSWVDLWIRVDEVNKRAKELEESKKRILEQERLEAIYEKERAAALAASQQEATRVKTAYSDIAEAAENVSLGINGWRSNLDAVTNAYFEIKKAAANAAKSATEAAQSFLDASTSIHEEYLNATGREEEAIQSRYAARKRDLSLQYEQLNVQIQIARIQAQATGISTAGLDAAAEAAAESFARAMGELGELENIALNKSREEKANKTDPTNPVSGGGGANDQITTTKLEDPVDISLKLDNLTKTIEDQNTKVPDLTLKNTLESLVQDASPSGPMAGDAALGESGGALGGAAGGGSGLAQLNPINVTKIDLSYQNKKATVYSDTGDTGLIDMLKNIQGRSMSS